MAKTVHKELTAEAEGVVWLSEQLSWACEVLQELRDECVCDYGSNRNKLPPDLQRWRDRRKEYERVVLDAKREAVLAKLTHEEQALLGLR